MERTLKYYDTTVSFTETEELKQQIFEKVIKWIEEHKAYHGESIHQNDDCLIDAPDLISDIVDNCFEFKFNDDE